MGDAVSAYPIIRYADPDSELGAVNHTYSLLSTLAGQLSAQIEAVRLAMVEPSEGITTALDELAWSKSTLSRAISEAWEQRLAEVES